MWLEAAVLVLVLVQTVAIVVLWQQSRRLQQAVANRPVESNNVPSLLIVNALNKIEHRLGVLEERAAPSAKPVQRAVETQMTASMRSASPQLSGSNYELAQHLAREGGDVEQLMERCGLSRNEAELVLRLYARRA
ncbi:DUF2802 domain-containing protein [Dyella acidiphila]|uniref:DUF2802 domain-containing protein n=1 Tax=Dyella acidiphila TaxID=2775866 RepID=A0ABR9G647_9GAMM|nr:DUF2802 domain-containing protein [Dyella acidiphila]MBE1159492.1 DUF2802 domain-containing protein [Dyella acidiphila]